MHDVRPSSWTELQEHLFSGSWDESLGRFRSPYAFHGLSNAAWNLETSLMRLRTPASQLPRIEGHLLRNFRKYAHRDAAAGDSLWNWLAVAQHHGLPTRLLDWTYSPYVALHFATSNLNHSGLDGVVWCVNFVETNRFLPPRLQAALADEGSNAFTAEMLDRTARTLTELGRFSNSEFALFLEPPSLNARIVNQYALFCLMSSPAARLDHWLEAHPELFFRIVVPAALKQETRDKLDQANITERTLFPDLDGLSMWLKRHYSPRTELVTDQTA